MKIYVEKQNKHLELEADKARNGAGLLERLSINPDTVILVKNGEVVLPEEDLSETDDIKILSVISGG